MHISGGNDTVTMSGNSSDIIFDDPGANLRPMTMPDGSVVILPGSGPSGNDTVHAGGGVDTIVAGDGVNLYDGGGDADIVDFSRATADVTVDLRNGYAWGYGYDTLVSIECVLGSSHNDVIIGSGVDNFLNGGRGDDTLIGGAGGDVLIGGGGNDTISYASSSGAVTINLATGAADGGDAHGDMFSGIANVVGSSLADTLIGDRNDNRLTGGGGRDVLTGGLGRDTFAFGPNDSLPDHPDVITDFKPGEDKIDLSGLTAMVHAVEVGQDQPQMVLVDAFSGAGHEFRTVTGPDRTMVLADLDGDRVVDFAIQVNGALHLTAGDFLL